MFREANAVWKGGLFAGEGHVSTQSGVLKGATYAFDSLSGGAPWTTPCEMLAASIASCMSTMVAVEMAKAGMNPAIVETHSVLTLDNVAGKWQISRGQLDVIAHTIDLESARFEAAVKAAQHSCPISNALNLKLECKTKLVSLATAALV